MAITKEKKQELINEFGSNKDDTGKTEVQIAILTSEIIELTQHMKKNKKDNHSKVGLYKKVSQRDSLLAYLKSQSEERYLTLIKKLKLRK